MKDAKGHGSDPRGGGGTAADLYDAASKFSAAHQSGINEAAPSQSGRDLYAAAVASAMSKPGYDPHPGFDAKTLRDMEPDIDEDPDNDPWSGTGRYAR